jgi:multisubunit Na+/H+ antiporter MnhF subunit
VNEWLWAAAILAAMLALVVVVTARRSLADGLVTLEFGGGVGTLALLVLAEGTRRQAFVDLALVFAVTSLIGAIAFLRFVRRTA